MTIARDIRTGQVVGQVTRYTNTLAPTYQKPSTLTLLTKHGYVTVPASTVRLEKVS
jgi:hypothetical protein